MDPFRLKDRPESKNDFHAHECDRCGKLIKFQWKVKGSLKHKPRGGCGSYHVEHTARHLENHCDEVGRLSIQQRSIEKVMNN